MKRLVAFIIGLTLCAAWSAPAVADDQEQKIGAQVYQDLRNKGEILDSSPYYTLLNPIATRIARVANPQYDAPFRFILVHEKAPNAFAVPGGNVYVTDSLMKFVQNREELAGVLCHETSHTIHHDVMTLNRKAQTVDIVANVLSIALGKGQNQTVNTILGIGAGIQDMHFSRDVERAADLKGADTCASAGFNPWGMVWLFQQFEKNDAGGRMEFLSDHPSDQHRIDDLETHFQHNPRLFAQFNPDISTGTPLAYRAPAPAARKVHRALGAY